jgi:hypothetical protein
MAIVQHERALQIAKHKKKQVIFSYFSFFFFVEIQVLFACKKENLSSLLFSSSN